MQAEEETKSALPYYPQIENQQASEKLLDLKDNFVDKSKNKKVELVITSQKNKIVFKYPEQSQNDQSFIQQDLIGASVTNDKEILLNIMFLVRSKGSCGKKSNRSRVLVKLVAQSEAQAQFWKNLFVHLAKQPKFIKENFETLKSKQPLKEFKQKLLVFVNPASGPGKAPGLWKEHRDLFVIAGYQMTEITTNKRDHAYEYLLELSDEEIMSYDGIVGFSGDGLPHEIINALALRKNSKDALNIGVGYLPGGSGNGMGKNICERSNEPTGVLGCVFNIIKGQKLKQDLIELKFNNIERKVYSFLSVNFAFLSDLDINSESMRFLGEFRFDLYGFYRAMLQRNYNFKVYTKIAKSENKKQGEQEEQKQNEIQDKKDINLNSNQNTTAGLTNNKEDWELYEGQFKYLILGNQPYITETSLTNPLSKFDDGFIDINMIYNAGWSALFFGALGLGDGSNFDMKTKKPKRKDFKAVFATDFIVETDQDDTLICVDGEKFEARSVQGKMLPSSLSIFCHTDQTASPQQ